MNDRVGVEGSVGAPAPIGNVLVVDDESELTTILVEALEGQGYGAVGYTSGVQALQDLQQQNFDVLLTDLMMPEMDGITLFQKALKIDPHLIGIIMTGQGTIQTAVDAMKLGALDYVLKPFRMQTLLPVLTRAFNARHLQLENLQLRETIAIHGLSQTIAFTLEPQTVLSKLADAALQQSEADEVSILLPTADGKELYVAAVRGERREQLLGQRIPLEKSISSWVAREREPLILNGEVHDERFIALWPRPEIRSSISVPMQVANKMVGVINLNVTSKSRPFTPGQMKALTILASSAASALESASLFVQVRNAEEKYRSIFENAVEGIFQATPGGQLTTVNPALARMLGYESAEEVIESINNIQQQFYVDPAKREVAKRLLNQHGLLRAYEFEAYRKDGTKIWLSENRRSVRDANGEEIFWEGTLEDITARKLATEALRESEEGHRLLFQSCPLPLWVYDLETLAFLAVNQAAINHYGYSEAEFLGMTIKDIRPPKEVPALLAIVREASPGLRTSGVWAHLKRDGSVIEVEITSHPITFSGRAAELVLANDVTERLQGERENEELNRRIESERLRLNNIVAEVPGVVWETWGSPDSSTQRIDFVSDYVEKMLGYSVQEWLDTPNFWLTIVHPEDKERSAQHSAQDFAQGKSGHLEFRWLAKDGRVVWVESQYAVIYDEAGEKVGLRGVNIDVTERKRAEQALQASERRFSLAFNSSPQPISIIALSDERYLDVNDSFLQTSGFSRDELIGHTPRELDIWPAVEDRERLTELLRTAGSVRNAETLFRTRNGEVRVFLTSAEVIDLEGQLCALIASSDITDHKQAEQRQTRRASQSALRADVSAALAEPSISLNAILKRCAQALVDHLGAAFARIWTFNKDENVLELQASAGIYTHLDGGHARVPVGSYKIGLIAQERVAHITNDVQHDERVSDREWAAREGMVAFAGYPLIVKDRLVGVMALFARELLADDTVDALASVADVISQGIERKRVEEALVESEERLRQSQKLEAIGQLAGGVAHDFNNLLTVIGGYSSILLGRLPGDSPHRNSLEEIKRAGDRASGLTRQLLAFSRKQMLQPKVLDLNSVTSDLEKMVRRLIGEDIDLLTLPMPGLGQVKADPGQVEQVLLNLIVNSRDAMPHGGRVTIETANVDLSTDYGRRHSVTPGRYVMLAVTDSGCGMDTQTQSRIFEPFFTTKGPGKGTGLGLATVYGIVKQSGGSIWVYSEIGKGTTFKIYFPRVQESLDEEEASGDKVPAGGSETLLIVEDEDQVRGILKEILEEQGYKVLDASQGEVAQKIAREYDGEIALLITDVVMPLVSGRELAEILAPIRPTMKVLYMSGYTDDAIVRHGLLDDKLAFIQKPFDAATVTRKIREVLDAR